MGENDEIAHFEQFHLFHNVFLKFFFFKVLKRVYMEERVKNTSMVICPLDTKKNLSKFWGKHFLTAMTEIS